MKQIKNRQDIAKVLNFGIYPVIKIDMDQEAFLDVLYKGDKVRVDFGKFNTGERYLAKGEIIYNSKDNTIEVSAEPAILAKDLSYKDYEESWQYASSPILDDNQEVVIVMHSKKKNGFKIFIAKTSKGDKFCQTIMTIE